MKESFFGKQYDIPQGMSSVEFDKKISNWSRKGTPLKEESFFEKLDATEMLLETKRIIDGISLEPEFSNEENNGELEKRKGVALSF